MTETPTTVFQRSMHSFGALMITLSALSPTIGVFVVGSEVIHQVGTAVFPCYLLAVLVGVLIANVYGELGTAFPDTGGEYTIVGRVLGPAYGFSVLGINLLGLSIANAVTGLGMSSYLAVLIPGLPQVWTAVGLDVIVTAMAILNVRLNALVTGIFLAAELLALAAVAVLGFTHPHQGLAEAAFGMKTLTPSGTLGAVPMTALGAAAVSALYAFNGYGSTVFLGEELHEAPKRLARVVFWALGIGAVAELLPVLGILVGAPDLKALIASDSPIAVFATAVGGPLMAKLVSLAVAMAIFNCMVVVALLCGRQLYATGRDGAWPGPINRFLASVHPRFNSPWKATILMGVTAMAWCFVPKKLLLIVIASGVAALYSLLCITALVGRRTGATAHAGYRMPLGPVIPVLGLAALIGVVIATWFDPNNGKIGLLATAGVIAFFVLYYLIFLRKSGWGHKGPAAE